MVLFAHIPVAGDTGPANIGALYKTKADNGKTVREFIVSLM